MNTNKILSGKELKMAVQGKVNAQYKPLEETISWIEQNVIERAKAIALAQGGNHPMLRDYLDLESLFIDSYFQVQWCEHEILRAIKMAGRGFSRLGSGDKTLVIVLSGDTPLGWDDLISTVRCKVSGYFANIGLTAGLYFPQIINSTPYNDHHCNLRMPLPTLAIRPLIRGETDMDRFNNPFYFFLRR